MSTSLFQCSLLTDSAWQVFRFILVGGGVFVFQSGLYAFLVLSGVPSLRSVTISFISGLLLHYLGSRFFTFRSTTSAPGTGFRYLVVAMTSWGMITGLTVLLEGAGAPVIASGILATLVSSFITFIGLRVLVFRPRRPQSQ